MDMDEMKTGRVEEKLFPHSIEKGLKPQSLYQMGTGYDWWISADEVEKYLKTNDDIKKAGP